MKGKSALKAHWVPYYITFPLVVFFFAIMVYPFINMVFQGAMPPQDLLGGEGSFMFSADAEYQLGWRDMTWRNYLAVFEHPYYRSTLVLSLVLSVVVSVISIALCFGPAWLLARKEFFGKRIFRALLTVPMAFSGVIIGFLAVIMIGRVGVVPRLTDWAFGVPVAEALSYSLTGLGIAYTWFQIPRATLNLESAIRKFDWDLESAARSLGASQWQALRHVLFPLLTPAIVSTMAVTFAVSMGSFGVALLLLKKSSVLALEIYTQMYGLLAFELAAAMSVVLAVITVGINYFFRRYGEKHYAFAQR